MSLEEADDAHEGIDTFDEFSGHFRTVPSDYGHLHPLSHGFVRFRPLTFVFRRFSPTLDVYVCFPAFPSNFENSYVRFRSVPSDLRHDVIVIWRGPRFVLGRFGPIFDLRGSTRIVDWEQTMGIHGGMSGKIIFTKPKQTENNPQASHNVSWVETSVLHHFGDICVERMDCQTRIGKSSWGHISNLSQTRVKELIQDKVNLRTSLFLHLI